MNVKAWWENGERKGAWSACKAARYAGGENENGEVRLSVQRYGGCDFGCFCGECWGGSRNERAELLFHCGDNGVRYAFVLGGRELCGGLGDFLSRYGKGGDTRLWEEKCWSGMRRKWWG
ncbi:hypothetical protein [Bartonella sp. AA9NXGY]|uniref:hypothetical protein n=1 Tax=Bartonella sp. AA9NXGY TaxID=3243443 RepID=UPI0035D01F4F